MLTKQCDCEDCKRNRIFAKVNQFISVTGQEEASIYILPCRLFNELASQLESEGRIQPTALNRCGMKYQDRRVYSFNDAIDGINCAHLMGNVGELARRIRT